MGCWQSSWQSDLKYHHLDTDLNEFRVHGVRRWFHDSVQHVHAQCTNVGTYILLVVCYIIIFIVLPQ